VPVNQEQYPEFKESGENYRAFLLRCWQEADAGPAGEPAWRFTLVQMGQGQTKKGFACLEELLAYLDKQLADTGSDPQPAQESNMSD
jgi:hypothetical protein